MRIYDLHADIGTHIYDKHRDKETDILKRYHIAKLQRGDVRGVAMACFFEGCEDWDTMQQMVSETGAEIQANPQTIRWVRNKDDLIVDDKLLALISVEGMCGIDRDAAARIDWLYDHGVRIGSLCWNDSNALATGWPNDPLRGLTELGAEAIRRMNERHLIIDVSHTNEKSFWDIISLSTRPIIATHSDIRHLCDHQRNLTDQQLKAIAAKGGVVGLNAAKGFISPIAAEQTAERLAAHARYMADIVGYQHIACGFDYMDFLDDDYENAMAQDLPDASHSQNLIAALAKTGFTSEQIEAIAYRNVQEFLINNM